MKKAVLVIAILFAFSGGAYSFVFGGSNLTLSRYESFSPYSMPSAPFYSNDQWMWDSYRAEVEDFRRQANEYIENAENDIERIEEEIQKAIDKVNSVIDEYNTAVSSR